MSGMSGARFSVGWHANGGIAGWSGTEKAEPIGETSDCSPLEEDWASRASRRCSVCCSRALRSWSARKVELRLQRGHLGLQERKPRSQIGVGNSGWRHLMLGLVRPGIGTCESRLASLKNTIMQASQDVDLLTGQALDPRIGRMGVQGHLGLRQPTFGAF